MAWTNSTHRFRLWRDRDHAILAGVCAGIADYIGAERTVVRLIAVAGFIFFFVPTAAAYLILAVMLPPKPPTLYESPQEEKFWRGVNTAPVDTLGALKTKFRALEERLGRMEGQVASGDFELHRKFRDLGR